VGALIIRLHIYHSYWSSRCQRRAPLAISLLVQLAGHRPLLQLTSAFRMGSLVICHCLLRRFIRRKSSSIGGRESTQRRIFGYKLPNFQKSAGVSQRTCRLPSRVIRDWTELHLTDASEILPSQCPFKIRAVRREENGRTARSVGK